jgi:uncharacterized CHY-type Zn-finger protein
MSILCTCCSRFYWNCFISFTMFCAHVFSPNTLISSLSSFVITSKCLKNFNCAADLKRGYIWFWRIHFTELESEYFLFIFLCRFTLCDIPLPYVAHM